MTDNRTTEFIIDLSEVEKTSDKFKMLFNETIPLGKRIVRCRDCVYFDKYENDEISVCYRFDNEQPIVEPDGFCAWGERKVVGE